MRVVIRGFVDDVQTQSMQWMLRSHQQICLKMTAEMPMAPSLASRSVNTDRWSGDMVPSGLDQGEGRGVELREHPHRAEARGRAPGLHPAEGGGQGLPGAGEVLEDQERGQQCASEHEAGDRAVGGQGLLMRAGHSSGS